MDVLPKYYAAADALIHPSEHDPHPLVCSEGAAIGLPLLLSDRVGAIGATDIARKGENALVFRCGDIQSIAETIYSVAGSPERHANLSAKSVQIFSECNLAASLDGLQTALQAVCKAKRYKAHEA